jgi:hypothetical protein
MKNLNKKEIIFLFNEKLFKNFIYRHKDLIHSLEKDNFQVILINIYNKNLTVLKKNIDKKKNSFFVNFLKKNFSNLPIYFYFQVKNIKYFEIYALEDIKDYRIIFNYSLPGFIKKFFLLVKMFFLFLIYSLFSSINLIQKPLFLLHTSTNFKKQVFTAFDNFAENTINTGLFKSLIFLNLKYYDKIFVIKPLQKKNYIKKKNIYIVFLDSCFEHADRLQFDKGASNFEIKNYYENLNNFFDQIETIYKKKILFLKHPDTDYKNLKKFLPNIRIINNETDKYLYASKIVFFHESSTVITGIKLNKKIINLKSKFMGDYFKFRNDVYVKKFKIKSIDIDKINKIEQIKKIINQSKVKLKKFNYQKNFNKKILIHDMKSILFKLYQNYEK